MAPDAPSVKPETTPQRYQIVTSNGSDLATMPPLDVRAVSIWPAAHGGWIRFRDYEAERAELIAALKAMVASYDGLRDVLTCPTVIAKLAAADAALAKAERRS